jgi:hypothetical protein
MDENAHICLRHRLIQNDPDVPPLAREFLEVFELRQFTGFDG